MDWWPPGPATTAGPALLSGEARAILALLFDDPALPGLPTVLPPPRSAPPKTFTSFGTSTP